MGLFETIPYERVKNDGHIEIREYDSFVLASTKTSPTPKQDSGFNNVFNYISGNNSENKKISMTTPVVTYEQDNKLVTGFYIAKDTIDGSIPEPTNHNVYLDEKQSSTYAVIKFRGRWTEDNFNKHDRKLLHYLDDNDYEILSSRFIFRYQPPMVPSIFRRNEIAYQVTKKDID